MVVVVLILITLLDPSIKKLHVTDKIKEIDFLTETKTLEKIFALH